MFITIFVTCGYTRLTIKQVKSGLYYYVKNAICAHWRRIAPSEVMDFIHDLNDCETQVWLLTKNGWRFIEGISLEIERISA